MRVLSLLLVVLVLVGVTPRTGRHVRAGGGRTRRVRPYVSPAFPITPAPPPYEVVPRGRVVRPYVLDVEHRARLVEERRRWVDEQRLGVAVLMDLGTPVEPTPAEDAPAEGASVNSSPPDDMAELAGVVRRYLARPVAMWHCPVPGCVMAAPRPVAHPCPLTDTPAAAQMAVAA